MEKADVKRVAPHEARRRQLAGEALLVCAYESDQKFQKAALAGARSLREFKAELPGLPREQEIIFYCG